MKNKENKASSKEMIITDFERIMTIAEELFAVGQSIEIYPRGVSMMPLLREGVDSVVLSPISAPLRAGDIVLFRFHDRYVLHRLLGMDSKGGYVFCGDNRTLCERGVPREHLVAVVSDIKRRGKPLSFDSLRYKNYLLYLKIRRKLHNLVWRAKRRIDGALKKKK